jgi:hypothetical protein
MSRPEAQSENPREYEVEVKVTFNVYVDADNEEQAEEMALYDWSEWLHTGEVESTEAYDITPEEEEEEEEAE